MALAAPRSSGCGGAPAVGQRWGRRRRETERDGLVGAPPRRCARMTTAMKAALPQAWGQGSPRSPTSPPLPPIHLPNTPPPPPPLLPLQSPPLLAPHLPALPHILQLCLGLRPARSERESYVCGSRRGTGLRSGAGAPGWGWWGVTSGAGPPGLVCSQCREGCCRRAAGLQSAPHPAALGRGLPHILPFCPTSSNSSGGCPISSSSGEGGAAPYPPILPHILQQLCPTSYSSRVGGGGAAPHLPILPLILQQLWGLPHILQLWGGGGCPISSHSAPHRTALRWGGLPHICQFCLSSSSSSGGLPHILQLCPTSSSSGGGGGLLRNLQFCPISSSSWAGGAAPHPPAALGGGRVLPHIMPPPP